MKKFYFAIAALLAVALVSCQREQSFNGKEVGKNALVFSMQGNVSTRATDAAPVRSGELIELTNPKTGDVFFLEEEIVDLNYMSPATKGTPAYTENIGKLYANDMSVYSEDGTFGTATFENMDDKMVGNGWRYQHNYNGSPWPDSLAAEFYINMPAKPSNVTINSRADGKFTFKYTSPATASAQQDILFAYRHLTKEEHDTALPDGAPVLFNHALTGVKFAIANYNAEKKVTIKSITFNGLYDDGTCEIIPAVEDDYTDNITEYSSSDGRVVWKSLSKTKTPLASGTFGAPVAYGTNGDFGEKGKYPESFASGGNTNNLNNATASQTFWLIPQTMSADVTLTIVYTCGTDEEKTGVFEFGKALNTGTTESPSYVEWKAGELRTYTIKVDDVNVAITDKFTADDKTDVVITNTGVTEAYIRAAIIGQWVDPSGNPVFGFTDFKTGEDGGQPATIPSWDQDFNAHQQGEGYFGTFDGLPGTNWVRKDDGYYYYTLPVAPGAHPEALFTSYTINDENRPKMRVGGKWVTTTLLIDIATQAIAAKKQGSGSTTTYIPYDVAWQNAAIAASEAQAAPAN